MGKLDKKNAHTPDMGKLAAVVLFLLCSQLMGL